MNDKDDYKQHVFDKSRRETLRRKKAREFLLNFGSHVPFGKRQIMSLHYLYRTSAIFRIFANNFGSNPGCCVFLIHRSANFRWYLHTNHENHNNIGAIIVDFVRNGSISLDEDKSRSIKDRNNRDGKKRTFWAWRKVRIVKITNTVKIWGNLCAHFVVVIFSTFPGICSNKCDI